MVLPTCAMAKPCRGRHLTQARLGSRRELPKRRPTEVSARPIGSMMAYCLLKHERDMAAAHAMFRAYLRMSKHDGERPLMSPRNQQNGYLRSSISLERGRSGIAGWRLSRRYGRGTNGGTVLSSLPARVDHDFSADRIRQAVEMLTVDPLDLQVAQDRDVAAHQTAEADPLRNAPDK